MKIKIDALKDYDPTKANASLKTTYTPNVQWNEDLPEEEKVTVEVEYLKSAVITDYMTTTRNDDNEAGTRFDLRKIFRKQVKRINNLEINDHKLTKAVDVLEFPSNLYTDTLVQNVAAYLISSYSLTGEEVKN